MKKIADNILTEAYQRLQSVWKVGEEVGLSGQHVHVRLRTLGVKISHPRFTDKDKKVLLSEYLKYRNAGNIQGLANKLGRTKQFICRKAKDLGLTDPTHRKSYLIKKNSDPYFRQHARVRVKKGSPKFCEKCGENNPLKRYEWANLAGDYDNPDDYMRMCILCHRGYDLAKKWFYGHGPNGEMVIENNQSHFARMFGIHSASISLCLNGKQKTHKGWTFRRIEFGT